ncbi:hypothetical protein QBC40DRAFT_73121 [Triangularia verruculosa]|uniref:BZIP domain-containing protein n=1 Tax=Triangularia verruculosa TaxID=2587418 RepID=A0AAN6XIJ2_9PEZI|nr:hypothetical protein QBC40DRAFT_73121 [Triangularia verruculosa]
MKHRPGETTTAGLGCHPTYTTTPLTPSPMEYDQEAINTWETSSAPALPAGTSNGGGLMPTTPTFVTNELPEGGLSYGYDCNNWPSTIADGFNWSTDAAVALNSSDIPVNWSTSQLSYAFIPKIPSIQEAPSEHLPALSFWLRPQVSYPTTPYTDSSSSSSFFPDYPNPAPETEDEPGKRRNTFDASYLGPRNDLTYPPTEPAAQPQLNANHLFPPESAYCHGPHHGLPVIPNEQSSNSHAVAQHRYEHHAAAAQETRPTTTGLENPALSEVQSDAPIIIPKRRRGRPPKHDVAFPRQTSNLSTSSRILSSATTTVGSHSSLDTAATDATTTDGSPGSSSQPHGGDQGDDGAPLPNKKRARGGSGSYGNSNSNSSSSSSYGEGTTNPNLRSRNRQAAIRYRVKTQAAAAQLEAEEQEVSQVRKSLLASHGLLKEELYHLKNEVLRHAGCDCPLIQAYLARAAQQVYSGLRQGAPAAADGDEGDGVVWA